MTESRAERPELIEQELLESPATHFWVRDVILRTQGKDPVDVLAGAEAFLAVARERLKGVRS